MIDCTVGVMAYNEAANIGQLLAALLWQRLKTVNLRRIVVVASGCTDETAEIVERIAAADPRVRLIAQPERRGKAAAINEFLPQAAGEVVVLESADTVPESNAIELLVRPFADPSVGMTGARPVPTNDPEHFWGHAAHLLWGLHHDIAQQHPKLGELVAFRNVVRSIPENTAVDEASLEAEIAARCLEVRYIGEAVVYNAGPETLGDFLRQRRRIYAGHLHLRDTSRYQVSTMRVTGILRALARRLEPNPRRLAWTAAVVALEAWARALGAYDYRLRRKNPFVWDIAQSTKAFGPTPPGVNADQVDAEPWSHSSVKSHGTG
jgi:cellulose synthase/poly-beta-1,6-N-acetylglucosamine synthase-like glycosyltransferase